MIPSSVRSDPGAESSSVIRASPKSRTFTDGAEGSSVTTTFPGLRSRWTTPRWWA